jgi:hypothetical protein
MSVYQLAPPEIYSSYMTGIEPDEALQKSRNEIATRLRVEEGLSQEDAYFAADQILAYARTRAGAQQEQE